ncbi:MAG: hypothetical protein WBL50_18885 [Candidatus Acidiferrum sp.]
MTVANASGKHFETIESDKPNLAKRYSVEKEIDEATFVQDGY